MIWLGTSLCLGWVPKGVAVGWLCSRQMGNNTARFYLILPQGKIRKGSSYVFTLPRKAMSNQQRVSLLSNMSVRIRSDRIHKSHIPVQGSIKHTERGYLCRQGKDKHLSRTPIIIISISIILLRVVSRYLTSLFFLRCHFNSMKIGSNSGKLFSVL